MLDDLGRPLELALVLQVDPDELMERLVGRVQCDSCGAEYNIYVNPPIVETVMIGTQSQQGISFTSRGQVIH